MPGERRVDHYYSAKPVARSEERVIEATLLGASLRFITDAGVFSKEHVDPGTRLLVESAPLPPKGRVLDLGCGYGVVGIAVAKARPDLEVELVDINERAVDLARRNAALNGVSGVTVRLSDGFAAIPAEERFALILTNPPYRAGKDVVYALVEEARQRLEPDGALAVVGRTKQGVKSLKKHMEALFGNAVDLVRDGGYRVIVSRKAAAAQGGG